MNQARQEVIQSGECFEAEAALCFLDQSDEIRRNPELNKGKTLTQVLQEEERRKSGRLWWWRWFWRWRFSGDKSKVCTEIYQTNTAC